MSLWDVAGPLAALVLGGVAVLLLMRRAQAADSGPPVRRILLPFVGTSLSERALEASLRLARAEHATLVPAYLVTVPRIVALRTPVPRECDVAFELFEAIEQRAAAAGVPVDTRIERGRTLRHALRLLMAAEPHDRIVAPAATNGKDGFSADDVAWLLRNADGEVLVLRPADERRVEGSAA